MQCVSRNNATNSVIYFVGLLQQFLGVNSDGGSGTVDLDGPILLEMQSDILLIISCLCETDMHRKVHH